ncbi:hypothetical protein MRX96_038764 [Rhipicephalus microplus]
MGQVPSGAFAWGIKYERNSTALCRPQMLLEQSHATSENSAAYKTACLDTTVPAYGKGGYQVSVRDQLGKRMVTLGHN